MVLAGCPKSDRCVRCKLARGIPEARRCKSGVLGGSGRMEIGQLLVPARDVGVGRALRHSAAVLFPLAVIDHVGRTHCQTPRELKRQPDATDRRRRACDRRRADPRVVARSDDGSEPICHKWRRAASCRTPPLAGQIVASLIVLSSGDGMPFSSNCRISSCLRAASCRPSESMSRPAFRAWANRPSRRFSSSST